MSVPASNRLRGLEKSFKAFNRLSESLESTYHNLEGQVDDVYCRFLENESQQAELSVFKQQNKFLDNILQALPAGVIVLDSAGKIVEFNCAAEELLSAPLRNIPWLDVVSRAFFPQADDGDDISLQDGRRVNVLTCPLSEHSGQLLLLSDVSEKRFMQQQLNQHERLRHMGQTAASLAHQIRTPLSAGLLYGSQLRNPKIGEEKRSQLLEKMLANFRNLENLVNDMLLFSKSDSVGEDRFTIDDVYNNIDHMVQSMCINTSYKYNINVTKSDAVLVGNLTILMSAVENIISNAFQALSESESGEVGVQLLQKQTSSLDIIVEDNGSGINKQIRENIFDPFFTTKPKGTGLGLAVVRAVIRAHQGEVWIDETYHSGARFVIRLPIIVVNNQVGE